MEALIAALTERARRMALARGSALLRARRTLPDERWRSARLLWPLFGER